MTEGGGRVHSLPTGAGSLEELGLLELHARAWAVVEPRFLRAQREAAATYHQLAGTGLTSRDPREIVRAAKEGRVEILFAARQPTGAGTRNGSPSPNGDRTLPAAVVRYPAWDPRRDGRANPKGK